MPVCRRSLGPFACSVSSLEDSQASAYSHTHSMIYYSGKIQSKTSNGECRRVETGETWCKLPESSLVESPGCT